MEYRFKQFLPSIGAYIRTLGYIKSVNYHAQCNDSSDLRFGSLLNETLTVEVFDSSEQRVPVGAFVSFEAKNNPAATEDSRQDGWADTEWTYYGVYKVYSVTDGKGYYSFTAYSAVHDLDVDYSARLKYLGDNGAFPMTAQALVADACQYIGIPVPTSESTDLSLMDIGKFYSNGITVKDILCAAAELRGCFVVDSFGQSKTVPAHPTSANRGVNFAHYSIRLNDKSYSVPPIEGYYLISPTDAPVDHSAFDIDNPRFKRTLFSNVYYKENGFSAKQQVNKLSGGELVVSNGDSISIPGQTGEANIYRVTNNILANNFASTPPVTSIGFVNYANIALGYPVLDATVTMYPATLRLFPFNCPFRCGDIANVTNGNGINFQMPIMSLEINDYEVVLTCTGNEFYETSQGQYSTPEETGQSNAIEINKLVDAVDELRDTKAAFETGYWTPVLYDNNTQLFSLPEQQYTKVGDMVFCTFDYTFAADTTVSTMLQVRGLPVSTTWGGTVYWGADVTGRGGTTTIQGNISGGRVLFRPNITGTLHSGTRMTGLFIGRA